MVASASSDGTIVTNGMSYFDRAGENANSAVLVSVTPEDFGNEPLAGAEFISRLEQRAYELGGGNGNTGAAHHNGGSLIEDLTDGLQRLLADTAGDEGEEAGHCILGVADQEDDQCQQQADNGSQGRCRELRQRVGI